MKQTHETRSWISGGSWSRMPAGLPVWFVLLGCCGCRPAPSDTSAVPTQTETPSAATAEPTEATMPPEGGTWYVAYIGGAKVGYERTATSQFTRDGQQLVRIEGLSHMVVKRFGEQIEQDIQFKSLETPDGKLLEFEVEYLLGTEPTRTTGRVTGDELQMEVVTKGKKETSSIPWSADYGGFMATEQSLSRNPMTPGQHRTIHAFLPGFNVLAAIELVARDNEPVELLTGTYNLLRIDTTITFPDGLAMKGTRWIDRVGETFKSRLEAMEMELFRASRAEALEEAEPADFDLGLDVAVEVNRPLATPHETKRVRYRVRFDGGDPAGVFASGASQQVKSVDPHTVEVTVYALRPDTAPGNPDAADDPPDDDDRKPNNLIQSDYPAIVAKARQVAGEEEDPWLAAVALERCVQDVVSSTGYGQAFATAAEVIDSGEGDCTENAVLLAAMARARGIPARVAIGLVYKEQSFYYHMWTEVHPGKRWIPLDATLGQGGIGAAHLKMAHSNLKGASALSSLLPVLQVIGRLEIEVLEVE